MRRTWLAASALLLAGCGVQPSGVTAMGDAPTGVASGVTVYLVDQRGELQPQLRRTGRLGTVAEAISLLLTLPGSDDPDRPPPGLHSEITSSGVTLVEVSTQPGLVLLRVPLAAYEVTPRGIDQLVCTAVGVVRQNGGSATTKVQVTFTLPTVESGRQRTCPVVRGR
jgi:hypothetical protein